MHVFITGGGGFLGYRLARSLLARGTLAGADGKPRTLSGITCFDAAFPSAFDARLRKIEGNVADPASVARAMPPDTGAVFHLAAVVSAGAEADFDGGYRVNLDGTRHVLEAARKLERPARMVYTSSVAAFGGDLPAVLDDSTTPNPQTSYGAQKVIGEYLVTDYTRKGFLDGRSLRLPTIVVRPGKPNLAASSFASGIMREPLAGEVSRCPVPESTGVWLLSPDKVVEAFVHAHELPSEAWGMNRVLNLPGLTISVRDMVAALARVAGPQVAARVEYVPDDRINKIVQGWPVRFRTERALRLGFSADADFESVIRMHMRDQGMG
jgi:D-erythronate 2-dehydrogenase